MGTEARTGGKPCIGAVIVTYHPDLSALRATLDALLPQVDVVFIVDNGSGDEVGAELKALAERHPIRLSLFSENRGIAAAQNKALCSGIDEFDFIVLFDQDSIPSIDLVRALLHVHGSLTQAGDRVAAVGARWFDQRSGRHGRFYRIKWGIVRSLDPGVAGAVEVDFLISSGTLLSMDAVKDVGGMREDFFIDHVDTEWCIRAKNRGWKLYGTARAQLAHSLGERGVRIWLGRWREVAVHSPERNYYEVRNTVLLLRSPGIGVSWCIAHLTRLVQLVFFYALLVPPRGRRIRLMAKALRHAIAGRAGKLE